MHMGAMDIRPKKSGLTSRFSDHRHAQNLEGILSENLDKLALQVFLEEPQHPLLAEELLHRKFSIQHRNYHVPISQFEGPIHHQQVAGVDTRRS